LSSYSSENLIFQAAKIYQAHLNIRWQELGLTPLVQLFFAAMFLVSVPVFFQAPLVREWPWISLLMTLGWLLLSYYLIKRPQCQIWGDLLLGFTGTWLTGGIYWGWFRWEPLLHLPVEAALVPVAVMGLRYNRAKIGSWFYLGSLFGTAITDAYFYLTDLIPYWRKLMHADLLTAKGLFAEALAQIASVWGVSWAIILIMVLAVVGIWPLHSGQLHKWAFGGAVLSTILVDGLFFLAACVA
jgi:hypothetical protein